jgi:hypothetical protein
MKCAFKRAEFITEEALHFGQEGFWKHKLFYVTPPVGRLCGMQPPKSVQQPVSKPREIGGFVLGTLAAMLGALALGYAALWIFAPADASPPDTSALQAKLEVASSAQTTITSKLENLKTFRLEPRQFFEQRGWSNSEANRLLDEYKPDLANFEAFSKLERVVSAARDPKLSSFKLFTSSLTNKSLLNIAKLADLMLVRAELKGRSSDPKGFFNDLLIVARVAKLTRSSAGTLVEYLVGSKMLRSSLERLRAGVLSLDMKPDEWKSRLDALATLDANPEELQNSVKTEFRMQQLAIQEAGINAQNSLQALGAVDSNQGSNLTEKISLLLPGRYNFQANATLGWFSEYTNSIVTGSASCPPPQKMILEVVNKIQNQTQNIFAPNAVGRSLFAYLAPNLGAVMDSRCKIATDFAATITVTALRGFQLENKDLPKKLDELTGKYLSLLPIDPYSSNAQPLELNLQRRVLQSKSGDTFKLGF